MFKMRKNISPFWVLMLLLFHNCSSAQPENPIPVAEHDGGLKLEKVVDDVEIVWGIAQLPDGSLLYTEKAGQLIHFKEGKKTTIHDFENVYENGQGGFFEVVLHPNYEENGWIYLAVSISADGEKGNTAIYRAKLADNKLIDLEQLYKGMPDTDKPYHFGGRIAFDKAGYLYFSIGDRGDRDNNPQDITKDGGKIYRINDDGSIPESNPFFNTPNAKKAIYSYGHRNPQGLVLNPTSGKIWDTEHGPRGGDEVNIIEAGKNFGWPVISYGINYNGTKFTDITKKEGMEQPLLFWVPSIAPCGTDFVTSDYYGDMKGDLLVGSLKFRYLNRCVVKDGKIVRQERLFDKKGRVRDIYQAPDGFLYVSLEYEGIYKIVK